MHRVSQPLKANARQLRKAMTDAEQFLWRHIRKRQLRVLKFRRQHPCGSYIIDFACVEYLLALEIDGGQHQQQEIYDAERTRWLQKEGWTVLRFWNNEVLTNLNAVLEAIDMHCKNNPHPNLPPKKREGISA